MPSDEQMKTKPLLTAGDDVTAEQFGIDQVDAPFERMTATTEPPWIPKTTKAPSTVGEESTSLGSVIVQRDWPFLTLMACTLLAESPRNCSSSELTWRDSCHDGHCW